MKPYNKLQLMILSGEHLSICRGILVTLLCLELNFPNRRVRRTCLTLRSGLVLSMALHTHLCSSQVPCTAGRASRAPWLGFHKGEKASQTLSDLAKSRPRKPRMSGTGLQAESSLVCVYEAWESPWSPAGRHCYLNQDSGQASVGRPTSSVGSPCLAGGGLQSPAKKCLNSLTRSANICCDPAPF